MLEKGYQPGPLGSVIPWWTMKRSPGLEQCLPPRMGTLITGATALQCSCHVAEGEGEDHPETPSRSAKWAGWRNYPSTPLCQDASGVHRWRYTRPGGTGVSGGVCASPLELLYQQQEECMMELRQEMSQHMTRVGLREGPAAARLTSHSQRSPAAACPCGLSTHQLGHGEQKQPNDQERTCQWGGPNPGVEPPSKCRNELQWCWGPSPLESCIETSSIRPIRHSSPSPSPLCCHPVNEQLNCSLSDLHLHPQQQESMSQMQRGSTPMHAEGCPPSLHTPMAECPPLSLVQKQVWFNLGDDLGEAPSLPTDVANFVGGNASDEQNDPPHPQFPLTLNPHSLHMVMTTHTRGAWPKTTV